MTDPREGQGAETEERLEVEPAATGGAVDNTDLDEAALRTEQEIAEVEAELDELRKELEGVNDRHLRLAAEFDNYRKRSERERQTLAARLQAGLVASLLDVVDDLERVADGAAGASAEALVEGVRLVERKFLSVLRSAGLEEVEAEGALFDPEWMEAVAAVTTDDPAADGRVADVFQRGFRFGDLLIRPARVRVQQYDAAAEGSD
jgi:molecular chaperone GrpE